MDNQNNEAHDLIVKAREALRRGDKESAHNLAEQAALLSPGMEDAWLVLTASDPNPEDALAYAQQALEIDPSSERALHAVEWAIARLKQAQKAPETAAAGVVVAAVPVATDHQKLEETKKSVNRTWIYVGAALVLILCLVAAFAVYQGVTSPTVTSILSNSMLNKVAEPTQENHWAPMSLPKPSLGPAQNDGSPQQAGSTPTLGPTQELPAIAPTIASTQTVAPVFKPTNTPASNSNSSSNASAGSNSSASSNLIMGSNSNSSSSTNSSSSEAPTEAAAAAAPQVSDAPQVVETPAVMSMELVTDVQANLPAKQTVPPSSNSPMPAAASDGSGTRWIDVDLTNQMLYAYQGDTVVNSFLVSTGTWLHPTVVGQYNIYVKYRSAPMSGPGYYLPDVPYIMYFYGDYGLHGTYWHNNFGTPMSHGCVNLRTDEAAWLYSWASVGTLVNIHY
jgi:lipoprotein-anchoring transpeptidase ErfK/SrfK